MNYKILSVILVLQALIVPAFAEILGEFSFDEIVLNASYEYMDPKQSTFSLDGSLLAIKWEKEKETAILLALGPLTLINRTIYFDESGEEQFGFVEASARHWGAYGQVEMGLIPILFSIEGREKESERLFYRGLVFSKRLIGLRDFGIAYSIQNNNFYTRLMVHNGEGRAENPDGRIFYSAFWGWLGRKFEMGVSAQTGDVKLESLNPDLNESLGLYDLSDTLKLRSGAISMRARSKHLDINLEAFLGQVEQNEDIKKWHAWHGDIIYKTSGRLDVLARVDYIDPNRSQGLDAVREYTLGLSLRDKHRNSRVFLYATKVVDEGDDVANDRYSLVWRLQPIFLQ